MDKKFVINIGRQLGSGGRGIAAILAKHYGITAYDRNLIELAAKESGFSQEFFENADEKKSHGFFHSIFSNRAVANALGSNDSCLSNDALFKEMLKLDWTTHCAPFSIRSSTVEESSTS